MLYFIDKPSLELCVRRVKSTEGKKVPFRAFSYIHVKAHMKLRTVAHRMFALYSKELQLLQL